VTEPVAWHRRCRQELRAEHARHEQRSRLVGMVRLAVAACAVGVLVAVGLGQLPPRAAWASGAAAATFVVLVLVHARVDRRRDRADAGARFHEHALRRLGDDVGAAEPGAARIEEPNVAKHPYCTDLDVLGAASLFAFAGFARTQRGVATLAGWLLSAHDPPPLAEIERRQGAARELSRHPEFARSLWVSSEPVHGGQGPAARTFEQWASSSAAPAVGAAAIALAWAMPVVNLAALVLGYAKGWPAFVTWGPYLASVAISFALRARLGPIGSAVVSRASSVDAYAEAFDVAVGARFEHPLLASLCAELEQGRNALRQLRVPVSGLEALQNEVFRLLIAPLLLAEVHAVAALERWRVRHGKSVRRWLEAYGELESLSSLGMMGFDFPGFAWPELSHEPVFEARALGHPLVPAERRVCNDVGPLGPGHALVVTGSNMSGKSTLLRSVGAAAVFALAGGPVCAERLVVGRVRLVTSMRVADSLTEGASRFYAELERLKLVCDMAQKGPGVLFLLDEILAGTNARERIIGARSAVKWLLEHGALGAVSTHDLGLAEIGDGPGAASVRNVHFEEQVAGEKMSFDYRLRDGVVKSSNALRLMRQLGLPVDAEPSGR